MKVKARYENGVLIPEKPLFPRQPTLTIEVADEDMEPGERSVVEPTPPANEIEWTEWERETCKRFSGLRKAWEILRNPPSEIFQEETLTKRQEERWEAMELRREERKRRGRPD